MPGPKVLAGHASYSRPPVQEGKGFIVASPPMAVRAGLKTRLRHAAIEDEIKRRVARELHDRVVQTLTAMLVELESFKHKPVGWEDVQRQLDSVQGSTREVLTSLRQLLHDLRGEESLGDTFVDAVGSLVSRFDEKTGISARLTVLPGWPDELTPVSSVNLYRLIEEALTNVRMHSRAQNVTVTLQPYSDAELSVAVWDDGRGVDATETRRVGLGTIGMQERALFLGGHVRIESQPGGGTTVLAVVPIRVRTEEPPHVLEPAQPEGPASETVAGRAIRVLIADDQTLFRAGLARLLDEDPRVVVVGQAVDGGDAIKQAATLKPDVVLMDVKMPSVDGIEATRKILEADPGVKIIILTTLETDSQVIQVLKAGASGHVLKDSSPQAIVSGIVAVMSGERVMASTVANRVLEMLTGATTAKEFYDGLTAREIEILRLLANGMANKQIAYRLKISDKTVRNHVSNTYEKLGIYDRSQAVLYAVKKGLVEV